MILSPLARINIEQFYLFVYWFFLQSEYQETEEKGNGYGLLFKIKLIYQLHLPLIYQNRTKDATINFAKN